MTGMVGWPGDFPDGKRPAGVHPWALVGAPPEHRDWNVGDPYVAPHIGHGVLIDAFCTVDAGMVGPPSTTYIGNRSWLQKRVHVGHNARIGVDCEICVGTTICGEVVIGHGVKIGGNTWIKPQVKIGDGAIIGGGSVVTKDIPAHEVWAGSPARRQKRAKTHPEYGYCECGCGEKTPLARQSSSRAGWVKGEPIRFVHNHHGRRPVEERFWEKVSVTDPDGCWEWQAKRLPKGYGLFWDGSTFTTAHRYSFVLHSGEIPEGRIICHHCDNPPCVNPNHLYAGTYTDNMLDLHRRGRATGGQVSPHEAVRRNYEGQIRARAQYDMTADQWEAARAAVGYPSQAELDEWQREAARSGAFQGHNVDGDHA